MIVCSCFGTTDRQIREAYCREIGDTCPAGRGCGNCTAAVREIVAQLERGGAGATKTPSTSGSQLKVAPRSV